MLWPILFTLSVGIVALAVYVERTALSDQIAGVDAELVRIGQRDAGGPVRPPVGDNDLPPTRPGDGDAGTAAPEVVDDVNDVGAPVQILIAPDGVAVQIISGTNPFSVAEMESFSGRAESFTVDGETRYRVRASSTPNGATNVSALPLDEVDASIASLRRSLLLGGTVIFVLVGALVLLIATAVTRPVTRMSRTANRIAAGELDTPIDPPRGSRETADLAVDLEQMVHRLTTSLDDANRARNDMRRFLADASHELRTPLTSLRGYSDLYAQDMLGEPGHLDRAMARVGSESTRLAEMVDDMLQLASGDARTEVRREAVDLATVVRNVVGDIAASHPDHHIETLGDADTGAVSSVLGDRARLHQCILNLVANACRHGGDRVEVVLGSSDQPGSVAVSVVDHGDGVAAELTQKIFLPFYRGDESRARDGRGGAGLGLALSKQIAEEHGGRISVESTEGGGATFTLSIPSTPDRSADPVSPW